MEQISKKGESKIYTLEAIEQMSMDDRSNPYELNSTGQISVEDRFNPYELESPEQISIEDVSSSYQLGSSDQISMEERTDPYDSDSTEGIVIMKLDALKITERRPQRNNSTIKSLEKKLRVFFNEDDGHGSLIRKPPPAMMTPQFFKVENLSAEYPILKRMDWIAFVNYMNFKKKLFKDKYQNAISNNAHGNLKEK